MALEREFMAFINVAAVLNVEIRDDPFVTVTGRSRSRRCERPLTCPGLVSHCRNRLDDADVHQSLASSAERTEAELRSIRVRESCRSLR